MSFQETPMLQNDKKRPELIPVTGGTEVRSVSALLAVLSQAPAFAQVLLSKAGAPARLVNRLQGKRNPATVTAITQPSFPKAVGRDQPDGLLELADSTGAWRVLIEAKVNGGVLTEQVDRYYKLAKGSTDPKIDALLLISNDLRFETLPKNYGRGGVPRVKVVHMSWTEILAAARRTTHMPGLGATLEGWIVEELIRYLENDASGVVKLDNMGKYWNRAIKGAAAGALEYEHADDVVPRIDQVFTYASFKLASESGSEVDYPGLSEPETKDAVKRVLAGEPFKGRFCLPGKRYVDVEVDMRSRKVTFVTTLPVPANAWANRRKVEWLVGQLPSEANGLVVESLEVRRGPRRLIASEPLNRVREDHGLLLPERGQSLGMFRLIRQRPMKIGKETKGRSPGFVKGFVADLIDYHDQVVAPTELWTPSRKLASAS